MPTYPNYTPASIFGTAGVARAQYAIVNPSGYPLGPTGSIAQGASRGMGVHVMVKRAAGNYPGPRLVNDTGDNGRKRLKFAFTAADIGEFDADFGAFDMNMYAAVTGTKIRQLGDWNIVGFQTDQLPNAAQVCLLFNVDAQEADVTTFGQQRWFNLFIPLANVYPLGTEHAEAAEGTWKYRITPVQSGQFPWGASPVSGTDGYTKAAGFGVISRNPLTMDTFIGDGSTSNFTLNYRPTEDATGNAAQLFRNGSSIAITTLTIATKNLVMASAGSAADVNVVVYEAIPADLMI